MINLKGKNLCERRKELNFKIIEAVKNNVDLQEVKCRGDSDIDRIFKIDLASHYKNVDYILEELKSGDSLFITRALKCEWLYDSKYAYVMNPEYLHHNIFPKMPLKMKNKTLNIISFHVRDETRAQLFYEYCQITKRWSNALKFLLFTSEYFKNELMNDDSRYFDLCGRVKNDYFKKNIGNSFILADTYGNRGNPIMDLVYLYSLDEEKYLDLLEKHFKIHTFQKFHGVKMSRSILKKHKDRILRKPLLYIRVLNKNELIKYSTSEDAQVYATALLPDYSYEFWGCNYYWNHKYIFDLIKTPNMYDFLKNSFVNKYKIQEFEMTKEFYWNKFYQLMTFEQREAWALMHLQKQIDVIPEDENYKWYEYISFTKSFKEIKTQIYITTCYEKRSDMLNTLVKSAKTQRDLEELFDYYYKRHVNETKDKKTSFVRTVMSLHKVLQFDDACWVAFDLILHSLDVYNSLKYSGYDDILTTSLIFHIINNKFLSEDLQTYLKRIWSVINLNNYLEQLNDVEKDLVYMYMTQFFISIILEFETQEYNETIQHEVRHYLWKFEELRDAFGKKENYPEIIIKYMKLDLDHFYHIVGEPQIPETQLEITEGYLMRCLKEDASLIVDKLPLIKDRFNMRRKFRINLLLRKIALYFSNDIAKQFIEFCIKTLYESLPNNAVEEYRAIFSIVFAIFRLRDENIKLELMDKFAPTNPKIEHDKIGHYVLYTQQAICRFHAYSRPPVPLSKTALYLKGDYVHHCDNMFNMYLANLPPILCSEFIKVLIDAPLSIQKRGLRLAFKTFDHRELMDLVSSVWKKTKNVSLRQILYLLLVDRVIDEEGKIQEDLCELLLELTLTIHQDDADEVFACFSDDRISEKFRDSYLRTAWKVIQALPEKNSNIQRKTCVIRSFLTNAHLMNEEFLANLISDHVQKILCEQKLRPEVNNHISELNTAMWDLTARYVVDIPNEIKQEKSLKFVECITKECIDHWNENHNTENLIIQDFFKSFLEKISNYSSYFDIIHLRLIHIFEYLLITFDKKIGVPQIYSYFWDWKLDVLMRKVINGKPLVDKDISINFGLGLGLLIKELQNSNLFYTFFFDKIFEKILRNVNCLDYNRGSSLDYVDVYTFVAYGLTLTNIFETYVLALRILPKNPNEEISNEYLEVLKKIKEQNNQELNALLYDKFIYNDLKVRKFIF